MHIIHISSVHPAEDPRIRYKQLRTIHENGWRATLVTGDLSAEADDDVAIVRVSPGREGRIRRMLLTSPRVVLRAAQMDADLYHLHDPELLPWAALLRLRGTPIVYDVHEDYRTSIRQKAYLPRWLREPLGAMAAGVEVCFSRGFHKVVAEKYYTRRFPSSTPILNYPPAFLSSIGCSFDAGSRDVLYTGCMTYDRGALQLARLARERPDYHITVLGHCSSDVAWRMRAEARRGGDALQIDGVDAYVPFRDIVARYRRGGWLSGLALFPNTPHYREKQLTKFFEYMAVGLPIVASHFPAWRELIEGEGVGLCVDSEDPASVGCALDWLRNHPDRAKRMSERGRELVASKYNWQHEGDRLLNLYRTLFERVRKTGHRRVFHPNTWRRRQ